jgi:hypothetical protein
MATGVENWRFCREFIQAKGRFPELQEYDQQFPAGLLCDVPLNDVVAALVEKYFIVGI